MPKPVMKPWSRSTSTVGCDGLRSRKAIRASAASSPSVAAAHSPISRPASKLSVARVASAASIGSSGVSSAMTSTPASRAICTDGTMAAVSEGTSRMPLAPSAMQVSIAATWLSLSPSTRPA